MNIVFYLPYQLDLNRPSGSNIRPLKMIEAFKALGLNVLEIYGTSVDRKSLIDRYYNILDDPSLLGIYAESSTQPLALTDSDHLPRHPFLDTTFLKRAHCKGIPVSLFYRDVHWRFSRYRKSVAFYKRLISYPFYRLELLQLSRCLDILFLPSHEMEEKIPELSRHVHCFSLPPGAEIYDYTSNLSMSSDQPLELLYVGGVADEVYDIRPLLTVFSALINCNLNIVCREADWKKFINNSDIYVPSNINVLHASGKDLESIYRRVDVFCDLRNFHEYLSFSMPIKIFEALGHSKPIITFDGTTISDFVKKEELGWVVSSIDEAISLINYLSQNRNFIFNMQEFISFKRKEHTWIARAKKVISLLDRFSST